MLTTDWSLEVIVRYNGPCLISSLEKLNSRVVVDVDTETDSCRGGDDRTRDGAEEEEEATGGREIVEGFEVGLTGPAVVIKSAICT